MSKEEERAWEDRCRVRLASEFGTGAIYMTVLGGQYQGALRGMPYVEDVLQYWNRLRKERGLKSMGIGLMIKALKEGKSYGA